MKSAFFVFFGTGICLGLMAAGHAEVRTIQESENALTLAAKAIGAMDIEILRYSGSGSIYSFGLDAEGEETRDYRKLPTYVQEVNHPSNSSTVQLTRLGESGTEAAEKRTIDLGTPWKSQIDLWLNPHFFLEKALSRDTRIELEREQGVEYSVVRFETPDGHTLSGYIDDQHVLRKIRTQFDDPVLGERTVEGSYLDYEDFDGVGFPTIVVHKENGSPTLILIVKEVDHKGSG